MAIKVCALIFRRRCTQNYLLIIRAAYVC